jgi:hypothetical protein
VGRKLLAGLAFVLFPILLHAQAISPVTPKNASFSAGGFFSYGQMDYGQHHNYGLGAYADFDYHVWRNIAAGAEGEMRFMNFHEKSGVYDENFLAGPRVIMQFRRRFYPYAKVLAGETRFHYPTFISNQLYSYTTIAIGGGLDLKLNRRITIRPADFEYQHLDFPPTGLTPWVYSVGASYTIF